MRTRHCLCCLLAACLGLPLLSRAQSSRSTSQSTSTVSVRELSIPPKALSAFNKGVELLGKKDAEASIPNFQRAIASFSGYYEAYYELGEANLHLWRIADAEQSFRKSIELSGGKYAAALLALGAVLDYQNKFAEAEEVTRRSLSLDSTPWAGHYYLGMALFGMDRLEEAEKSVHEALTRKTNSPEALRLLADIHGRQKDYPALVHDLDEYLKLDPDSPISVRAREIRDTAQRLVIESQNSAALILPQR